MRYTVSSRGRPIGVTDLDFTRIGGPSRSGHFHPTEWGEGLMPLIASRLPAMRAYLHRNVRSADGTPLVQPHLIGSRLFADLAEALQHASALELTLHREDGSLVPTEVIGLQDTERLRPLADWEEPTADAHADDDGDDEAHGDVADSAAERGDGPEVVVIKVDHDTGQVRAVRLDVESPTFPRYQIHIVLDESDVRS